MTFKNIIEIIQVAFPNVGRQQIKKDINLVMKDYANETKMVKDYVNLFSDWITDESGDYILTEKAGIRIAGDNSKNWLSYVEWNLNDFWKNENTGYNRINKVYQIKFLNSNDRELYNEDALTYDIDQNGVLKFFSAYGEAITEIPSGIDDIQIHFYAHPWELRIITDESSDNYDDEGIYKEEDDEPEFEVYHDAIISGVMKRYHAFYNTITQRFPDGSVAQVKDVNMLRYFSGEYQTYIHKGKLVGNIGRDAIPINYKHRGF